MNEAGKSTLALATILVTCLGLYGIGSSIYNRFFARGVVRLPSPYPWSEG
jgi:hypothetical protein